MDWRQLGQAAVMWARATGLALGVRRPDLLRRNVRSRITYLLHHGAPGNSYYAMYLTPPRVRRTMVVDGATRVRVPLYESPNEPVFNFCRFGFEQRLKVRIPLGQYLRLDLTPGFVNQPEPVHISLEGEFQMKEPLKLAYILTDGDGKVRETHSIENLTQVDVVGLQKTLAEALSAAGHAGITGKK